MVFLRKLRLENFKSYERADGEFVNGLNNITGMNGSGKTNLLDAVYYCCFTKSYFHATDNYTTRFGADYFRLEAHLESSGQTYEVSLAMGAGRSKEVKLNGTKYDRISDHIGRFPAVMVAPDDNQLILGSSRERRRFMDACLSQVDRVYLEALLEYNRWIKRRNAHLKNAAPGRADNALLDTYDDRLVPLGTEIHARRKAFMDDVIPIFREKYGQLSREGTEEVDLLYGSELRERSFADLLRKGREKDRVTQRTQHGIHQDDLELMLDGEPLRKIGSQGQQKSFLVALKLAQYEYIRSLTDKTPLLLLDDIFDKLDRSRASQLISLLNEREIGQVFISDARIDRIHEFEGNYTGEKINLKVEDGKILSL